MVMEITAGEKGSLKAELTTVPVPMDQTQEVQLRSLEALLKLKLLDQFKVFFTFKYFGKLRKAQQEASPVIYTEHHRPRSRFQIFWRAGACSGI